MFLGEQISHRHLNYSDRLIGIVGDAGAGKSSLIKGMFPGLQLSNDDDIVNPRKMLKRLTQMAEDGEVHYFIIGFAPLSENRFRITDVSESWDAVIKHGLLVQCKVSLTIKEYV